MNGENNQNNFNNFNGNNNSFLDGSQTNMMNPGMVQNEVPNDMVNVNQPVNGKYKLTLKRAKGFVACLLKFKIYIDGVEVGKIKNGGTLALDVDPGQHVISVNKGNPADIQINGDTTADVVVFGANNFGISNINGQGLSGTGEASSNDFTKKSVKQANGNLIVSIVLPIVSVIMFFTLQIVIAVWIYGILIGYIVVNITGLKNIKNTDSSAYKSALTKDIIGIVISLIAVVLTCIATI